MALYAIGDTHLSLSCNKPMDVFGGNWENYVDKLLEGFSVVEPDDTVVLCGDLSWGMSLEQAEADFAFLDRLPGRKLLMKGNHDYWWTTAAKMNRFFEEKGFHSFSLLHNNCHFYGDVALCGTRGWFFEEHGDPKVFNRELIRLGENAGGRMAPISGKGQRRRKPEPEQDDGLLDPIKFRYREESVVDEPAQDPEAAATDGASKSARRRRRHNKADARKEAPASHSQPEEEPAAEPQPAAAEKPKQHNNHRRRHRHHKPTSQSAE